jgi:hypothetical protein
MSSRGLRGEHRSAMGHDDSHGQYPPLPYLHLHDAPGLRETLLA